MMTDTVSNGNLVEMLFDIFDEYEIDDLTPDGHDMERSCLRLNGCKLDEQSELRLMYIIRNSAYEVLEEGGYRRVISQVMEHYSDNNKILNMIINFTDTGKDFMHLAPLEHSLFLFRHSLEHHQDYA
jgi:hypothetical protein